jgi:hypothetical protein
MPTYSPTFGVSMSSVQSRAPARANIARAFEEDKITAALAKALNGAAPGATATAVRKQIVAPQVNGLNFGGKRAVADYTLINRATTAGDKTALDNTYDAAFVPATFPADKSGWLPGRYYRSF